VGNLGFSSFPLFTNPIYTSEINMPQKEKEKEKKSKKVQSTFRAKDCLGSK
jgi:hypothetical protein